MRWSGGGDATVRADGALELQLTLDPGAFHDLVLEISDQTLPRVPVQAPEAWLATETSWAAAVPELGPSLAAADSRHSYAVLAGLTSSSGGMVAAATMSLPERSKPAGTTTTATCGSGTSATPARRWPPTARTACWTTPSPSWPSASWPTART